MFISFRGHGTKFALSLVVAMLSGLTWFVPVFAQSAPPSSQEPPKPAATDQKKTPQEKPDSQQPEKKPEEKKKEGAPAPFEPIPTAKPEQPQAPAPPPVPVPTAPETGRPTINPVIEDIIITGNRRVPKETLRSRILTRKGDPFDADALRRDYMALWNTNLLDDIKLTTEDGTKGIIATFTLKERPLVRKIEYEGNKSITRSEILDRFKERKVGLSQESQFDPTKIKRAEQVLKDYLAERGRQFAKVTHQVKEVPPSSVELTFVIEEGPKVKVGKIEFQGNTVFSSGTLERAMKNERPKGIPPFFYLFHATYDKNKMAEDLERVRSLYQDKGYAKMIAQEPKTQLEDTGGPMIHIPFTGPSKGGKRVNVLIPVEEGAQYHMGQLIITGNKLFSEEQLRSVIGLNSGDVFSVGKIRKSFDSIRKAYGERGYINETPIPDQTFDDEKKTVDFAIRFDEGKQFFVHRIEFSGNTTTRDKVIRREMLLDEGDVYNTRLWDLSLLRINQLGFFEPVKAEKDADVKLNERDGQVDLTLKLKERGKQSISFNGGASGVSGTFIGLTYQTNNFLGLGETLTVQLEGGTRQKNLLFGFTEPYFRDRPLTTGFTVYKRSYQFDQATQTALALGLSSTALLGDTSNLQQYTQNSSGFTLFGSYPTRPFTRVGLTFSLENSSITDLNRAAQQFFNLLTFSTLGGPSALSDIRSHKITTSYSFSTVDHPFTPHSGKSIFMAMDFEGSFLGGNVNTYRPVVDLKYFHAVNKGRHVVGVHFLGSFVSGFGTTTIPDPSNPGQTIVTPLVAPPYDRFYTGGEDSIRGFDIRAVSPIALFPQQVSFSEPLKDAAGNPIFSPDGRQQFNVQSFQTQRLIQPGGDTQLVGNVEYRVPIFGPVTVAAFADIGSSFVLKHSQLTLSTPDVLGDTSVPLLPGTNFKVRSSVGLELQVVLPVVNAPFRLYYAYNPTRLSTVYTPAGFIPTDPFTRSRVSNISALFNDPNYFKTQVLTSPFLSPISIKEPSHAFRFSIGRTF
ncbi:MAG: outer membrane protein assembly factor BamA [Acidobacteriia bacterium]|nr:outer membrane protein assembly factor BamA [Terriglobia bacterium]